MPPQYSVAQGDAKTSVSQERNFVSVPTVCHIFWNYKTGMDKQGGLISLNTRIQFIKRNCKVNTVVKGLIHYHDSMTQETVTTIISRKQRKVEKLAIVMKEGGRSLKNINIGKVN